MKKILTIITIIVCYQFTSAQTASDVLENGIRVKSGKKIFLRYDKGVLKYDVTKSLQDASNPPDFITLSDSAVFAVSKDGVNIYINPLNPLNFSYTTETKEIADPINEAASKALSSIIDILSTTSRVTTTTVTLPGPSATTGTANVTVFDTCQNFNSIETGLKHIQDILKKDKKKEIVAAFTSLKDLTFYDEATTSSDIDKIEKVKLSIERHFEITDSIIESIKTKIENYNCTKTSGFITKYVFTSILKDLTVTQEEQKKRLTNLLTAFNMVKKAQQMATAENTTGLKWCVQLNEVATTKSKTALYTVSIKESGYKLSDKDEIVAVESKEILKKTIRIRKFQAFVPEVSVGTAFTFFKYNSYGTTSDSTGQQFVASPTENLVKNINISAMVNWNLYCPNSPIHPLIQLGAGIKADMPTLFVGAGLRFSNNAKNRVRITGGLAATWIKELDKLKVGDKISGTSDIDKDMKYGALPLFSPYVGIQYNF